MDKATAERQAKEALINLLCYAPHGGHDPERCSKCRAVAKVTKLIVSAEEEGAARSRPQIDELLGLLKWAGSAACSMLCPSTGKEGTPIPHLPECERLRAAVEAGETRDILRDAVRKYKAEESKP